MKYRLILAAVAIAVGVAVGSAAQETKYEPTWESLDTRPLPQWFADAKFGIFIHWGLYSVPSWGPKDQYAEWYWNHMQDKNGETWKFHEKTYGADFKYQDFVPMFQAELFNPDEWANVFKRSGAKYIVLTSKHHEGFCLWPSAQAWNWNAVDVGPHRDLAGDLIASVHNAGLRMGFYYSIYEWYNPLYLSNVDQYVDQHMLPQLKDLVQRYKPDIVWPDGEWDRPSAEWKSTEFLAWLYNESNAPKDVVVNDRWGKECRNVHGGFATPEYGHLPKGRLTDMQRWEECQGMGKSFGYNRNESAENYRSATELLHLLIDCASRGGNLLLDIGPTADGRIPAIMEQRLLDMGKWLDVNGEAIYGTTKWREVSDGELVRYTTKGGAVYAICLQWPGQTLTLANVKPGADVKVSMLGVDSPVACKTADGKLVIDVPQLTPDKVPCAHAYVFKLTGVE
ncbi:MAG: alpha-L-fucosidase [Candidatus Hydrogenedentes bacterium]|nr:alpha-L-fucosidase [Candidatus Hydrogenedentota bacterium]